ncbi:hypothetical protein BC830DRAFT_745907 [Chytriomyces sp. MP71]|nr:hypothetical protein BC830DRAFT_745907 [Chytriomyces sp. MP71]
MAEIVKKPNQGVYVGGAAETAESSKPSLGFNRSMASVNAIRSFNLTSPKSSRICSFVSLNKSVPLIPCSSTFAARLTPTFGIIIAHLVTSAALQLIGSDTCFSANLRSTSEGPGVPRLTVAVSLNVSSRTRCNGRSARCTCFTGRGLAPRSLELYPSLVVSVLASCNWGNTARSSCGLARPRLGSCVKVVWAVTLGG